MKDKNDWIRQGIKISYEQKISLNAFTKYSDDPKTKVHCIEYCKILRKTTQEDKLQHYSRLIAQSNSKIKTTWTIINEEAGKVHSVEQVPTLLVKHKRLKDPTNVANAFNNFFTTIIEKLIIQHIWTGDAIHILKDSFAGKFSRIKIIPINETEIKI
jgi:hypothetical protein